jgi:predicted nucleotidyltransferase
VRTVLQSEIEVRRTEIAEVCMGLGVRRLEFFGSGARSASPRDLDFLVDLGDRPVAEHVSVYFALLEGLQALFAIPVDLMTAAALVNPYCRQRVEREKALLYAA